MGIETVSKWGNSLVTQFESSISATLLNLCKAITVGCFLYVHAMYVKNQLQWNYDYEGSNFNGGHFYYTVQASWKIYSTSMVVPFFL